MEMDWSLIFNVRPVATLLQKEGEMALGTRAGKLCAVLIGEHSEDRFVMTCRDQSALFLVRASFPEKTRGFMPGLHQMVAVPLSDLEDVVAACFRQNQAFIWAFWTAMVSPRCYASRADWDLLDDWNWTLLRIELRYQCNSDGSVLGPFLRFYPRETGVWEGRLENVPPDPVLICQAVMAVIRNCLYRSG